MMRAIEFRSSIRDNKIFIPRSKQSEFVSGSDKRVRVLVFLEDTEEKAYLQMTKSQFLKGYANSDAIYDV
jgi:general stress protein 26